MCNSLLLPLFVHVQLPTFTFVHIQLPTSAFVQAQVPSFCYRLLIHVHIPSAFVCLYMYNSPFVYVQIPHFCLCRCTTSSFCVCAIRLLLHLCIYTRLYFCLCECTSPSLLPLYIYNLVCLCVYNSSTSAFAQVQLPYFCVFLHVHLPHLYRSLYVYKDC